MQSEIFHELRTIGTIILPPTTVLLVFVWTFLEKVLPIKSKQELETIYLVQLISTAIIILVVLSAFVIFLLIKKIKINKKTSDLGKTNFDLTQKVFEAQTAIHGLTEDNNKYQKLVTEQESKLSLFSKYTFDPRMSFFRLGDKGYCSVCLFKFQEVQIGVPGNQFKCPSCGTDYSRTFGLIDINKYYKPDD